MTNENTTPDDSIDEVPASIPATISDSGVDAEAISIMDSDEPIQDDSGSFNLAPYASQAYLEYALSVVKGRSLPDGRDGQKPVQRRILYSMRRMGLTSTSKHIKSARVVGEVMGKYHPHGDSSIYDAMVLSSQDFSRRYPLVDGQGNFGSRDGDGAAAMRYTEARLTPFAELLLSELDGGTVDFIPNYDGAFEEPAILPARMPVVLLNGASGAAVGYATEIPSHNMREVASAAIALIKNPAAELDELMRNVPAPDFPGGGQIISAPHTIRDIYATGKGSLKMRARWRREELARGQWRIVVYELPHRVSIAQVLSEIEAATNPQPRKGKKDLSQDQKNIKALLLGLLDTARDESDEAQPVRLVLEPKTSKISEDELMAALLVHTGLETSVPVNLVTIGLDGNPRQKSFKDMLSEWIEFRFTTVERRTQHRLDWVTRRLHILEGRMKTFLRIEEVIRIIRGSDEPKSALMDAVGLTDEQAEDILEIRLRQLARLEGFKIEKEMAELREEEDHLRKLLSDRDYLTNEILKEIEGDAAKYGDDRRTIIETVVQQRAVDVSVPDEPVTILISKMGWLRSRQGHDVDRATVTWKQSDSELVLLETRSTSSIYVLDTKGRVYSFKASTVPAGRGDGVPLSTLVEIQGGAKLAHVFSGEAEARFLFTGSGSYGYITELKNLDCRGKSGKDFMTLLDGEQVLQPLKVDDLNNWVAACSVGPKESRMVLFPLHEMKIMPKGRGVIVMTLEEHETLSLVQILKGQPPEMVRVHTDTGQAVALKGDDLKKFLLHRARKGCQLSKRAKPIQLSQ